MQARGLRRKLIAPSPVIREILERSNYMLFRRRHHRWIALIALLGLLFQQLAMASYICPMENGVATATAGLVPTAHSAQMLPCHAPNAPDKARCAQHCSPITSSADHHAPLTVPLAFLPATTWLREFLLINSGRSDQLALLDAHASAPPLTIQHCSFQI